VSAVAAPPQPAAPGRPQWRPWTAPAALILALTTAFVLGAIVFGIGAAVTGSFDHASRGTKIAATAAGDLAFVFTALFFAQLTARPTAEDFGLRPTSLRRAILWMGVAYLTLLILGGAWLRLFDLPARDPSIDELTVGPAAVAATAMVVCVFAPIAEEVLFRGYIFTALRGWAGVAGAAVIDGILFGAIHVDPERPAAFLVPLGLFGALLCLLYWRTGSLYPCIALHAINNALAFGNSESWEWWQVGLLAVAALTAITLILAPLARRAARRPVPA
jgi:membrane protease YdiL (CAAX protease family)